MKCFKEEFAALKKQTSESGESEREIEWVKRQLADKPLVLYGAGIAGFWTAHLLRHFDIKVTCFCDKNKTGVHGETKLPVISPQSLLTNYSDANIIISSPIYEDEIKRDLHIMGITQERLFLRNFINFQSLTPEALEPHLSGYERAYNLFADDISRQTLLGRIKCYLTPFPLIKPPFATFPPELQYFDPEIITLSQDEIFADGGMYVGDTAEQFYKLSGGKYAHYYGFEPERQNYAKANKVLAGKPNMTLILKGLWSSETQLGFSNGLASGSRLDETSGNFIDVTALDLYFSDMASPTFIKMDIEGAELEALKGAERIIREHKPKLAICAYHKPEDIYMLPELVKSYHGGYRFYVRHYANTSLETVFYAI